MPSLFKHFPAFLVVATLTCPGFPDTAAAGDFPDDPLGWPAATATHKPWTRWWWLGSGVDKPNLTRQLEDFAKAGIGGVEICPIYEVIGAEGRSLDFLSPAWMEMLAHTTTEAGRLGLGVDMTTGTGWPFGGPNVSPDIASAGLEIYHKEITRSNQSSITLPKGTVRSLRAWPEHGNPVDLAPLVRNGKLDWNPADGNWDLVGLISKSAIQKVKRAAPGGAGNVLDPFSDAAMTSYLDSFDKAFAAFTAPMPRAQFHDSFEYYQAAWTDRLFETFLTDHHYDLRDQTRAFAGIGDADTVARVRSDYRETLNELHLSYLKCWHGRTKARGGITRNQAHGSPGNLLDHYAVSEIPETEIFRKVDENQIPMMLIAASAARAKGDTLVSSETFTWLDEHFRVTPEKLKEAADFVFLGGVNHLIFHGIPYSPEDAPWPGWLFYASTHLGPDGGLWRDLPAFTGYIQRCQSVLQEGEASTDVLIYYPIHDFWHNTREGLPLFTIHNQEEWLQPTTFHQTAMELWNHGVTFGYASSDMLSRATVRDGMIVLGGHAHKALILPGVKHMPPETLKIILRLASQGARLVVRDGWPDEAPGLFMAHEHRATLAALAAGTIGNTAIIHASGKVLPALEAAGVRRERMSDIGLRFVRRDHAAGHYYFIVNRAGSAFDGVLPLAVPFKSAVVMDPWNRKPAGMAHIETTGVALHLDPGQSLIIRTFSDRMIEGGPWTADPVDPEQIPITGPWKIEFVEGGPNLPPPVESSPTGTWTKLPGGAEFSGTARYTTRVDLHAPLPANCRLDLGTVANTARLIVNGRTHGISWCAPHVVDITNSLIAGSNLIEVEVTNLAANRIAGLDRLKVPWKRFHEINFVNIDYKPFDASAWPPLDSGLIGPVRLLVNRKAGE